MPAPTLIAERFEVVRETGSGGMGTVYNAHDRQTGGFVALKILQANQDAERFLREARLLAELSDTAIVGYIAHGRTPSGDLYLAMEWLEGGDLEQRITKSVLSPAETVVVASRIAQALAVAHARGIVHRDIKPSNVFLPHESLEEAKVLDFGIALWRSSDHTRTRTGAVLGTPAYMAPEQARGARDIDARADVFALGCVIFECLTGEPAFSGEQPMAVLAKILFADTPRLRDTCPDVAPALDALVTEMLHKDPARRLANGAAVVEALARVANVSGLQASRPLPADRMPAAEATKIGSAERRSVVLVLIEWREEGAIAVGQTVSVDDGELDGVFRVLGEHGARAERLANGSVAALFEPGPHAEPTDTAAIAARCALALRPATSASLALAVSQIETGQRHPLGGAIDHATRLLASDAAARSVAIDAMAAGLLGARFEVRLGAETNELVSESVASGVRTLLGKPTPCVGRDRDLTLLEGYVDEAIEESRSRSVLVTAAAGVGKSRLSVELLRRLREHDNADLWTARGDPMRAGAPLGVLVPLVRRMAGVGDGEPADVQRRKLQSHVERTVPAADAVRIGAFLCELVGATASDGELLPEIVAARRDPKILHNQLRRAFSEWLSAMCSRRPVVILIDDLHWGDVSTVAFLDTALRDLKGKPFVVIALGRPEVEDVFPQLWASSDAQHIRLGTLGKKAGEVLVRHVLGKDVAAHTLEHIVEVSGGNAFFLEELIRAVAETEHADVLPETVLAMTSARLDRLPLTARRLLRGASIFGDPFLRGGVISLVGDLGTPASIDETLDELVRQEVITVRDARSAGETEYVFRHALVRDAAYAMLTDGDRTLGHRLAGEWLEASGEDRCAVIAEHFERGDDAARARSWYVRAVVQAIAATDFRGALVQADRAIALEASGAELIDAHLQRAKACMALGLWADARRGFVEALSVMGESAEPLRRAQTLLALGSACFLDFDLDAMEEHASAALALVGPLDAPDLEAEAIAALGTVAQARGRLAAAIVDLERASTLAQGRYVPSAGPLLLAPFWAGRLADAIARSRRFIDAATEVGDLSSLLMVMPQLGLCLAATGQYAEAERVFAEGIAIGEKHGSNMLARVVSMSTGLHVELYDLAEAERRAQRAFDTAIRVKFPPTRVSSLLDLLLVHIRRRDLAEIDPLMIDLEKLIVDAGERGWHGWLFGTRWIMAQAELAILRGSPDRALTFADEGLARSRRVGRAKYETLCLALRGEALDALGERAAAKASLEEAYATTARSSDPGLILRVAGALLALGPNEVLTEATKKTIARIASELPEPMRTTFHAAEVVRRVSGS